MGMPDNVARCPRAPIDRDAAFHDTSSTHLAPKLQRDIKCHQTVTVLGKHDFSLTWIGDAFD